MANICPICNNELRQYDKDFYVCEVCETYFDKNENIVLTEQEWLQTATTEQLSRFLYEKGFMGMWQVDMMRYAEKEKITVEEAIQRWLKQPRINKE